MTSQPNPEGNTTTWHLSEVRELFTKLIENRKRSWESAKFYVQSKQEALRNVESHLATADKQGWAGYIKFIHNHKNSIEHILPGKSSQFKHLRARVENLIYGVEKHLEKKGI